MPVRDRFPTIPPDVRELHNGDRMDAESFHRIYREMPEDFRAELVGGVVYVASPIGLHHSINENYLGVVMGTYAGMTPGVQCGHGATVRLSESAEPQPDIFLRIEPECGGQSKTEENFVFGPPELIAEIAHSSWALDLGEKYDVYRLNGVREYLVLDLNDRVLRWFDLAIDKELSPDADGIIRARQFPGLWLNAPAIVAGDFPAMKATLETGMATQEYRDFAARLAALEKKA